MGKGAFRLLQKTVELFLRGGGGVGVIKYISCNEQGINLLSLQGGEQPVEKTLVFVETVKIVQSLA